MLLLLVDCCCAVDWLLLVLDLELFKIIEDEQEDDEDDDDEDVDEDGDGESMLMPTTLPLLPLVNLVLFDSGIIYLKLRRKIFFSILTRQIKKKTFKLEQTNKSLRKKVRNNV